jgi:hypothetical protein
MQAQRRAPLPAWTPADGNPFAFILKTCRRIRAERQADIAIREAQGQAEDLERRRNAREFPED